MLTKIIFLIAISLIIVWEISRQIINSPKEISQNNLIENESKFFNLKLSQLEQQFGSGEISEEEYIIMKADLNDKIRALECI